MKLRILAIETSCDETGIAIVDGTGGTTHPRLHIHKQALATQIETHRPFGGVVPNLAKREHLTNLPIMLEQVMGRGARAEALWKTIDVIGVTTCPGLEPALWAGIKFAKKLGKERGIRVVGTHHLQGHLYSTLLPVGSADPYTKLNLPAIALIVSGGHTLILAMKDLTTWKRIGETRDDAVGEAFDKVARLLKLPYPGGPEIQNAAAEGNPNAIPFPRPMIYEKNYDMSFSGLKTAVLYYLRDNPNAAVHDVAASFQKAAIDVLVTKAMRAATATNARTIILGGGVAANATLRTTLARAARAQGMTLLVPPMRYNGDNAAMIGAATYLMLAAHKRPFPLRAVGRKPL